MSSAKAERAKSAWLSGRLPRHIAYLRRLAAADETFASLCAEYELALGSLEQLTPQPGQPLRPEIAEYHVIIAELAVEIMRALGKAGKMAEPALSEDDERADRRSATAMAEAGLSGLPATPHARRPGQPIFYRDPVTKLQMLHWLEPGDRLPRRIYDGMSPDARALLAADQLPREAG